jgi:glycosyltransferase involved in cell wall biosynthesis
MKLSIITATYNSERTLRDTMESILSQTFQDLEYIIVDGASKDATLDIIREYEPRFQGKMRYVSEPDKGIYDAMNKGFAMATGDVIGILNSDDFLLLMMSCRQWSMALLANMWMQFMQISTMLIPTT